MPITEQYGDGLASVDADVVAEPSDHDTFVAVFARTYSHSDDPAAVVDLYHDFQQLRAKHPNAGSAKLATKLGVQRSHIRRWTDDGAAPYVVRGLQTAETRGWIPMDVDSPEFRAMNRLVAWVMSSGTINERWDPQFVVDDDRDRQRLKGCLDVLGLGAIEPEKVGTGLIGTVLGVTPDTSVLGRVLHSLGAPTGREKRSGDIEIPPYLDGVPEAFRRDWLCSYLRNRRGRRPGEPWIRFREKRDRSYRQAFVGFVEEVTGESASTNGADIYVGADAVRELGLA